MKKKFKKYVSIITMITVMFMQTMPVYAQDTSTSSVQVLTPTPSPQEPASTTSEQPAPSPQPSQSPSPEVSASTTSTPTPAPVVTGTSLPTTERTGPLSDAEREAREAAAKAAWEQQFFAAHPELRKTIDNGTGKTTLTTGPVTNSVNSITSGNSNGSTSSPQGSSIGSHQGVAGSGSSVVNSGNGAFSNNGSSSNNSAAVDTTQTNSAKVGNNVNQSSITGKSSTSFNVGESTLTTGDSNVSGTAVTGVNTNLSNVQVSEFNVVDNQKGDLILSPDAFSANCISGCSSLRPSGFEGQAGNASASSGQGGAKSTNTASATNTTDTNTTQTNTAGVGNNLTLDANSGDNTASFNTGGDTIVNTGDANVSANSLTFANNNLAGAVTFGVVNIYGNLEGDILLPEFASVGSSGTAANTNNPSAGSGQVGNGAGSTNTASSNTTANATTSQNNDVTIANNVTVNGTTGGNSGSDNTSGNTTINTGKTTTDTNVLNITNTNITDGTWWLVLVNHAGNWVGKLLGAPDGASMTGSSGIEFKTDPNGQITATNPSASSGQAGNGAGSTNTSNVSSTTNTNTAQNNNADIENNLNLSANTGGNKTDFNTGGHNTINTGDSNIIANLVNFVNNNISGNGRLVVTVVNVFGSWVGDFVTPGQQKQNKTASSQQNGSKPDTKQIASNTVNEASVTKQQNAAPTSNDSNSSDQRTGTERIVSGFTSSPESTVQTAGSDAVKVAGISTADVDPADYTAVAGTDEKIITINLAWILLLLPFAGFGIYKKRKAIMNFWKK